MSTAFPIPMPGPFPVPCPYTNALSGHAGGIPFSDYADPCPSIVRDTFEGVTTPATLHWLQHSDPDDVATGTCVITLDGPVYRLNVGVAATIGSTVRDVLAQPIGSSSTITPTEDYESSSVGGIDFAAFPRVIVTRAAAERLSVVFESRLGPGSILGAYELSSAAAALFAREIATLANEDWAEPW